MATQNKTFDAASSLKRNFVAKYSRSFNKSSVFVDKKKASKNGYSKHKGNY